ncbi:MAG: transposase [Desulfocapsa sp.]|nr:transposase [Desulfocapsa sp.]
MGSTLSNLLYHIVFSTKIRQSDIVAGIGPELHRDIGGIVKGEGGILLEIGGMADHVQLVLKLKPVQPGVAWFFGHPGYGWC